MHAILPRSTNCTSTTLSSPWATEPVDRLICALDAQNLSPIAIVTRLKREYPEFKYTIISTDMIERRLRTLDQHVCIDYFKSGLSTQDSLIANGLEASRGVKHGRAIHRGHGETWDQEPAAMSHGHWDRGRVFMFKERRSEMDVKMRFTAKPLTNLTKRVGTAAPAAAYGAKRS